MNQVIWNSAHGHLFAYSVRDIFYSGASAEDHKSSVVADVRVNHRIFGRISIESCTDEFCHSVFKIVSVNLVAG